jgi:endonuclease/exonuclease/phosphatase family metal-dependent hydrolase
MSVAGRPRPELQYKLKSVTFVVPAAAMLGSYLLLTSSAVLGAPPAAIAGPGALDTILSGSYTATRAGEVYARASVLNWNIERGEHIEQVKQQIGDSHPDVCILQEVDLDARRTHREDVAKELAQTFHMNYVFAPEFQELGQGTAEEPAYHGQALLTKLPVRAARMIRFEHQSGWWKPRRLLMSSLPMLQRREGGRIALVAELDRGGQPLVVYDLHLESKGGDELRLEQLEEVLHDAERYPASTPIIIAGDLNTFFPHSRLIPRLEQSGFRNVLGERRVKTHVLLGELDWVFVRGSIEYEGGKVLRVPGSDHFPINVTVHL